MTLLEDLELDLLGQQVPGQVHGPETLARDVVPLDPVQEPSSFDHKKLPSFISSMNLGSLVSYHPEALRTGMRMSQPQRLKSNKIPPHRGR